MTTSSTQTMSPLRQRMLDDMQMRKLAPRRKAITSEPCDSSSVISGVHPTPPQLKTCVAINCT